MEDKPKRKMHPNSLKNLALFKKGEVHNPKGGSKKLREKMIVKKRMQQIQDNIKLKVGELPTFEKTFLTEILNLALNSTQDELKALVDDNLTPVLGKIIIKESTQDPNFTLKLYQLISQRTEGEIVKQQISDPDGNPILPKLSKEDIEKIINTNEQL